MASQAQIQQWQQVAKDAADYYGIPPELLQNLLNQESRWNDHPEIHWVKRPDGTMQKVQGIAQFTDDTAKEIGIDPNDPIAAIWGAAKYLHKNVTYFTGGSVPSTDNWKTSNEWAQAIAAYDAGAGNVDKAKESSHNIAKTQFPSVNTAVGEANWQQYLPDETKSYLKIVMGNGADTTGNVSDVINQYKSATGLSTSGKPKPASDDIRGPQISDYYEDDGYGGTRVSPQFYVDQAAWVDSKLKQQELTIGPQSKYIDDLISQMQLEISSGNLELNKASEILSARMQAYKTAQDAYSSDGFKYGSPTGSTYIPGGEPGGFANTNLGLAAAPSHGIPTDPMQEALSVYNDAQTRIGAIQTPVVPDIANQRKKVYDDYNDLANGLVPGAPHKAPKNNQGVPSGTTGR